MALKTCSPNASESALVGPVSHGRSTRRSGFFGSVYVTRPFIVLAFDGSNTQTLIRLRRGAVAALEIEMPFGHTFTHFLFCGSHIGASGG